MWYPNLEYPKSEKWTVSESTVTRRDYFASAILPAWISVLGKRYPEDGYTDVGMAREAARLTKITIEEFLKDECI